MPRGCRPYLRSVLLALVVAPLALAAPLRAQRIYDPNANARQAIDSALALARSDHKLVLIDLGADWCLDCVVLDRLFAQPEVQAYLRDHYHLLHVDVGRFDRNLDINRKYGDPIRGGVPAAVVLAPSGQLLVSTGDGALESARRMTAGEVLHLLQGWVALRPRARS